MIRVIGLCVVMLAAGKLMSESPAQGDDTVTGAVWELTIKGKTPKEDTVRRLRATPRGKIWTVLPPRSPNTPQVIGSWTSKRATTTMVIDPPEGVLRNHAKGTYEIVQVGKNPPSFRGKFTDQNAKVFAVQVKLIKD